MSEKFTVLAGQMAEILGKQWIPHKPTAKQMRFLLLEGLEGFYGGAAGGGKSEALLMGALEHVDKSGYAAILFRRTLTDHELPEGLIPRSHEWLAGKGARWNGSTYTWTFPCGATLTFGYMKGPQDHLRYQSSAYQYVAFDELPQFEEHQYRFMFSRLRRLADVEIPLRMRGAGNPVGVGVQWVKRRFVDPRTAVAPFIPARLSDNPHLDRESYVESLNKLDPITRRRLLEGDWESYSAGMFHREWFQVVEKFPAGCHAVRYWDLAATAPGPGKDPAYTVGALVATKGDGVFYVADILRKQLRPAEVEALVLQTAAVDTAREVFSHVDIYMEQEPGSSGVAEIERYSRLLAGYSFRGDKVTGSKELRATPVSSSAEAGNVKLVLGPWLNDFLDEAESFPEGRYKDQIDAVSGAFNMLSKRKKRQKYWGEVF